MLLFIDGFDHYTTVAQKWAGTSGGSIVSGGRHGNCLAVSGGGANGLLPIPGSPTEVIVGFSFKTSAQTANRVFRLLDASSNVMTSFGLSYASASGKIVAFREDSTAVLGTGTTEIVPGTWYYLELRAKLHATLGEVEVRINGVQDLLVTGVNTGSPGTYSFVQLQGYFTQNYDDMYIVDRSGSTNNDFLGDVRVETIFPTGAGAHTDFTPSAGSNWQNVDEATPNDDSDYNASGTPGDIDTFALGNLATLAGSVLGVQINNRWRKDDAGSRSMRRVIRTGGSDFEGADVSLSDSYSSSRDLLELNPDTAAGWTIADVNALEAGYKVQS